MNGLSELSKDDSHSCNTNETPLFVLIKKRMKTPCYLHNQQLSCTTDMVSVYDNHTFAF